MGWNISWGANNAPSTLILWGPQDPMFSQPYMLAPKSLTPLMSNKNAVSLPASKCGVSQPTFPGGWHILLYGPSRRNCLPTGPEFSRKRTNGNGEIPGSKKSRNDANSAWSLPCSNDLPCSLWNSTSRDLDAGFSSFQDEVGWWGMGRALAVPALFKRHGGWGGVSLDLALKSQSG